VPTIASNLKLAVEQAARSYEAQIEQIYDDIIGDLMGRYGVTEEEIEKLWDEVAP
jgi:hypothetical protein